MPRAQPPVVEADRGVEAGGRERRELGGHLLHARAIEIAQRDADDLAGADAAEQPEEAGDVLRVEPARRAGEERAQVALGARLAQERGAGGAAQEARIAGEERRDHARRAGEQDEGLEQVGLDGELARAVHVTLDAGQGEVGVGGQPARREDLLEPAGEAAAQAREALVGVRRARLLGPEAGDRVGGAHGDPSGLVAVGIGGGGAPRPARDRPCCLIFLCRFVRSTPSACAAWVMFQSCSSSFFRM